MDSLSFQPDFSQHSALLKHLLDHEPSYASIRNRRLLWSASLSLLGGLLFLVLYKPWLALFGVSSRCIPAAWELGFISVITVLLVVGLFWRLKQKAFLQAWTKQVKKTMPHAFSEKVTLHLGEKQLTIERPSAKSVLEKGALQSVYATEAYLFFLLRNGSGMAIPRSVFSDEATFFRWRDGLLTLL